MYGFSSSNDGALVDGFTGSTIVGSAYISSSLASKVSLGVNGLDIVSAFSGSFGVIPFFIVFNSPTVSLNLPL